MSQIQCRSCEKIQSQASACSRCGSTAFPFLADTKPRVPSTPKVAEVRVVRQPWVQQRPVAPPPDAVVDGEIVPLAVLQRRAIENALRICKPTDAARLLGIGHTTIYRLMDQYGLSGMRVRKRYAART
jgi:DNA-binding NtrC family response regulator